MAEHFWRDFSGRLTVDQSGITAEQFPDVCRRIAIAFNLQPEREPIIGLDQAFCDFRRGEDLIGMDWDIWMEFMVVAKTPSAEPLLREIGEWLGRNFG